MGGMARCALTVTTLVTRTDTTARKVRRACRWVRDTSATVRRVEPANTVAGKSGCPTSGSWVSGLSCPCPRLRNLTCSSLASSSRSNRPANTASCFSSDMTQHARSSCACHCTVECWNWGFLSEVMIHNNIVIAALAAWNYFSYEVTTLNKNTHALFFSLLYTHFKSHVLLFYHYTLLLKTDDDIGTKQLCNNYIDETSKFNQQIRTSFNIF